MNTAWTLLPALVLLLASVAQAQQTAREPGSGMPLWVQNSLDAAALAGNLGRDSLESLGKAADAAGKVRASSYAHELGNNSYRNAMANGQNLFKAKVSSLPGRQAAGTLGPVFAVAKGVGDMAGRVAEGDLSGAAGAAVENSAGFFVSSGGAAAGAKLFGAAGAAVGSAFPVVGTTVGFVVGGTIGAVGGGLAASGLYDAVLDNLARPLATWLASPDPLEQARLCRAEYKMWQDAKAEGEKLGPVFDRNLAAYGYGPPGGLSLGEGEIALPSNPLPVPENPWAEKTAPQREAPPVATSQNQPPKDPNAGIPLFPTDFSLTVEVSPEGYRDWKVQEDFVISSGKVSGRSFTKSPVQSDGCSTITFHGGFEGTIKDNVISGTWKTTSSFSCTTECTFTLDTIMTTHETRTLNMDHSVDIYISGGSMHTTLKGCGTIPSSKNNYPVEPLTLRGGWQYSGKGNKAQ